MAFPVSPTEGQTYTENNTVWIYSSTAQQWFRSQVNPANETLYKFGSASATGSAGEIQYTDGANLAASPDLVWDDVNNELEVGGDVVLDDGGTFTTTLQTITPTANRTVSLPNATGTVALVAGSSGQLVYNNAGAQAGAPGSVVGATGDVTLGLNGAASTPPLDITGTWFTGGTSTTTKPQVLIEPAGTTSTAWSTSGTGLGVNAPPSFGGRLFDFQINGTSRCSLVDAVLRLSQGTAGGQISFGDDNTFIRRTPGGNNLELASGLNSINMQTSLLLTDARDIAVGTTTGTKIGTATTQKLGFYNKTPVVQPTAVANATDAASVITQLNALLSRMRDLGLIAT